MSLHYIALDPGKRTGWAKFIDGEPTDMGEAEEADFLRMLLEMNPDLFVVEDYLIRPQQLQGGYSHQWNKGVPIQMIGAVRLRAVQLGIEVYLQQPSIKPVAAGRFDLPWKGGASTHMIDAVLHGKWFWEKNKDKYLVDS